MPTSVQIQRVQHPIVDPLCLSLVEGVAEILNHLEKHLMLSVGTLDTDGVLVGPSHCGLLLCLHHRLTSSSRLKSVVRSLAQPSHPIIPIRMGGLAGLARRYFGLSSMS